MFKLVYPIRGLNLFRRNIVVKLTSSGIKNDNIIFCDQYIPRFTVQSKCFSKDSIDTRIRNFYEYPDVNKDENDDNDQPYTRLEGAEHRHGHSVMEENKFYSKTIAFIPVERDLIKENELDIILQKNYRLEQVSTLITNFRKVSHHAKINDQIIYDPKYENIIHSLTNCCSIFSDDDILSLLKSLALWFIEYNVEDSGYSKLCDALDTECKARADSWPVEKILLVSDHWYRLRLIKRSKFFLHAMLELGKNPKNLSPRNFVQLMFYTSISRSSSIDFRIVESRLKANINNLDINEIAVIGLGFFKSQTIIRDRILLDMIIKRTIKEIDSINEISFAAILKIVRYSIHVNDLDFLCELLENTIPQIPRLSITCLVHVLLAAANRGLFYADLLNAVAARFYREISRLRLKDIRCLVFALSSFNYVPEKHPNIFDRVIEELSESERQSELNQYPQCFATCLHHLGILNIHPKNLIAQALDPQSIQNAYGSDVNTIRREILALDLAIDAEIPDYQGPRLDNQTRENVAMRITPCNTWPKTANLTIADHFMLDVIRACEAYFGSKEMVHVDHVLPQYHRPDIIICLDKDNSPIPISSMLKKLPFGNVKHPPKISIDNEIKWLALIIGSHNSYAKNTKRLLGHVCAKHRQLQFIGYKPFVIYWQDWRQLRNDSHKFRYLQHKVFF